jgi:probable phosphoglycerate mutase
MLRAVTNRRRVYLARHGDVSYFGAGEELGSEDPPLNSTGRAQAEALGQLLADAPIDLAACTGLQRTRQTAELAIGSRPLEIAVVEDLREAKTGTFEEIESAEEMEALFVGAFENAEVPGASFLTGEPYADLWARVAAAWQALLARDDWSQVFVAAHGVVNRTILAQALGAGPQIYRRLEQDMGCLNVLDIDGEGPDARVAYVRLVNFTPYNATKTSSRRARKSGRVVVALGSRDE